MTDPTTASPLCRLAEASDLVRVSALFARCTDYFLLQDGEPATLKDARELFTDVPPGRDPGELMVFGSRVADKLNAVAVLLPDHPEQGTWYLPFMLLDPAARGRGLGMALHAQLAQCARLPGARRLQLVVLDSNDNGAGFWSRLGYRALRRVGPDQFKVRLHYRIELMLDLAPP